MLDKHGSAQGNEQQEVHDQLFYHPVTCETVHTRISKHPASGQVGGVHDQYERTQHQEEGGEQGCSLAHIDQHQVTRTHQDQPGDQRGILHRIPCPETSKAQSLIRPSASHQDTNA